MKVKKIIGFSMIILPLAMALIIAFGWKSLLVMGFILYFYTALQLTFD